jgi:hypothetical protein
MPVTNRTRAEPFLAIPCGCCKLPAGDADNSTDVGVIWRVFKWSRPGDAPSSAWWKTADAMAEHLDAHSFAALEEQAVPDSLDEAEQREEMLDGLRQLLAIASAAELPIVETQHRVIGADRCRFVAPATLVQDVGTPGKLFVTSNRLVFAGGRVQAWPWHRVRGMTRQGRDLLIVLAGGSDIVRLQCNTYGDAMIARHLARRLTGSRLD